jgi:hypothetical protein
MIFCARATRGLRRPLLGLMARLGVPVGGRVRKLGAVEDQSAPILERERASLEGDRKGRLDDLLCSCNARSWKTLVGHAQWETNLVHPQGRMEKRRSLDARSGDHTSCLAECGLETSPH